MYNLKQITEQVPAWVLDVNEERTSHDLESKEFYYEFESVPNARFSNYIPATKFQPSEGCELLEAELEIKELIVYDKEGNILELTEGERSEIERSILNKVEY